LPRDDFTTDYLHGFPLFTKDFRSKSGFSFYPQQEVANTLLRTVDYSFDLEKVTPYNYSVYLDESHFQAEMAVGLNSANWDFNFEKQGNNFLVIDLSGGDITVAAKDGVIFNVTGAYAVFNINLEFETSPTAFGELLGNSVKYEKEMYIGKERTVVFSFAGYHGPIRVKYAISQIDAQSAKNLLDAEIPNYSLENVSALGREQWINTLAKYEVTKGDENEKRLFYTSVYRMYESVVKVASTDSLTRERVNSEISSTSSSSSSSYYVDPFLAHSYDALHPLLMLTETQMEGGFVRGLLRRLKKQLLSLTAKISELGVAVG
jgi:putative alpha-1,2-mannosidase